MANLSGIFETTPKGDTNSIFSSTDSLNSEGNLDFQISSEIRKLDGNSCNLIVNYLPQSMNDEEIRDLFSTIGTVVSCKLIKDRFSFVSLGYAFVSYSNSIESAKAIENFDRLKIENKRLKVSYSRPSSPKIWGANVYFSRLPAQYTELELEKLVSSYGTIINHTILRDQNVESRGIGFVRFNKKSEADAAVNSLNNIIPPGGTNALIVKPANPPKVFQTYTPLNVSFINDQFTDSNTLMNNSFWKTPRNTPYPKAQANSFCLNHSIVDSLSYISKPLSTPSLSIFVYNIPPESDDSLLYKLFSPFGAIATVKVFPQKSYGFVNMIKYEESSKAIAGLNGYALGDRILQVSFKSKQKL